MGDESFQLPYWNFDNKEGMEIGVEGDEVVMEMRKIFKEGLPQLFMRDPVRAREVASMSISIVQLEPIHNAFHQLVGRKEITHTEKESFSTAGPDMMHYGMHANVYKLWDFCTLKELSSTIMIGWIRTSSSTMKPLVLSAPLCIFISSVYVSI
ncbi:hypothetical protein J5N97_014369 [Dioscorea zingiberensis]|uniref:Uncharacterized protein n=1 Tax=Dioscorea zingiberensis TaxID=325984 RepID=A0A9D5CV29_9LILI|nr:hypothetical protein J5N97_014369 [Dioscorea zingiberensis]